MGGGSGETEPGEEPGPGGEQGEPGGEQGEPGGETGEAEPGGGANITGTIEDNQVPDATASPEQQQAAAEAQEQANQNEITDNISDEDFEAYIESILNGL